MMPRALLTSLLLATSLQVACVSNTSTQRKPTSDEKRELANTNLQLGVGYLQQGKFDIAQQKLLLAIEQNEGLLPAYGALALIAEQQNKPSDAEGYYRRALRIDASDGITNNNFGAFLCKQRRFGEALERYQRAVKDTSYPTPALAYENAGICALQGGETAAAETNFRKALELSPRLSVALASMAKLHYDAKRYMPARGYMQRFEEVAQHGASTLWLAMMIEQALGSTERANEYANRLKLGFPDAEETARLSESDGARKQ